MTALLQRQPAGPAKFICGAVLISSSKVLTAAHCMQNKNSDDILKPRDVIAFLGAYDLGNPFQAGTLSVSPSQIVVHPHWNPYLTRCMNIKVVWCFLVD